VRSLVSKPAYGVPTRYREVVLTVPKIVLVKISS